ncbi:phospholipase D family protein [Microbacterium sp.]|uniref:phospholipase D family protein n=1 Tax=Microbacterium sp. TaxID=51671 RepID=UPI003C2202EA
MLEPQSRAALTEQLKPPTGFELSHAVGTTFTLDLATALAVPLSFASHRLSAQDDTLGVLDAIRRAADRVDVFAQAGELSMGTRSDLVAFLEPMIHPVTVRRGLFHPKVWFLEFRAGEQTAYRFLCASRNLTADRSWDVVVRLDGVPAGQGEKREAAAVNHPLVDLLRRLPSLAVQPVEEGRRRRVEELAERWRGIVWERPDPMRSIAFHVFGIPGAGVPNLRGKRALIVSPFLSDDGLRMLRDRVSTDTHLISRAESLDRLTSTTLDAKLSTYVLDDASTYAPDGDDGAGSQGVVPPGDRLSGLHAKAVVIDRLDGAHVFIGSANATYAAWHSNVEVMVELIGPIPKVGVQATLDAFGELKQEYPTEGGREADANEEAERRLEAFVRGLASARLSVRVMVGDPHSLRVWADDAFVSAIGRREDVSVRWHLLTRPDLGSTVIGGSEPEGVGLAGVPLADITPFIVLVARDDLGNERRTIVLARLIDDVATRHDAIIARQLTDRAAFVRLLTLLLELSGTWTLAPSGAGGAGFFGAADMSGVGTGLFEALVRAVGEGHHGLADARRIIDYLRANDEQAVLPEGFDQLWSAVWSAHLELTGGAS